ncbi:hypothetical protein [Candidatus Poriferisodalis sp.]|uniref:hypothetical protein n=1 Tax=Candidatus Poriferisodalis sp. TaxID=3101277 RepID=UPI003C6F7B29
MSKKADHKKRKRAKARSRATPISEVDPAELPMAVRVMQSAWQRFLQYAQGYLTGTESKEEAVERITDDITAAMDDIERVARAFPIFDILERVRFDELAADPNEYKESETEGRGAVIELIAYILATSSRDSGTEAELSAAEMDFGQAVQQIVNQGRIAADLISTLAVVESLGTGPFGPDEWLAQRARVHLMTVRNPAYPHMIRDSLVTLFGAPEVETLCLKELGFTVQQACAVFREVEVLGEASSRRFQEFVRTELVSIVAQGGDRFSRRTEDTPPPGVDSLSQEVQQLIAAAVQRADNQLWSRIGADSTFDAAALATRTGLSPEIIERVLKLFEFPFQAASSQDRVKALRADPAPLRLSPKLRDRNGVGFSAHGPYGIHAVREVVEEKLKNSASWNKYSQHRGDYLEDATIQLMLSMLPAAAHHHNLKYMAPDSSAAPSEDAPASYTVLVECDALLLIDDIAIVVEAKSNTLRPKARSGNQQVLNQGLKSIVRRAADQATRLRDLIHEDRGLRLKDRTWLDLTNIREVHAIAVSLEDLSGIATVTAELIDAGLIDKRSIPWTVWLYDLRIISELIERPADLILYLRRRTLPEVTRFYQANDELDLFLEYFVTGLYVDPDPEEIKRQLPQFGEPTTAAKRKYRRQQPRVLLSRTDQLDAWYFYEQRHRSELADRPSKSVTPGIAQIVDALAEMQEPGWLAVGTTLLESSGATQESYLRTIEQLRSRAHEDGRAHDACIPGGTQFANSFILVFVVGHDLDTNAGEQETIRRYVAAKKHQMQTAIGAAVLFGMEPSSRPHSFMYDNRRPGEDAELDAIVKQVGLKPYGAFQSMAKPPPRTPSRITPRKRRKSK